MRAKEYFIQLSWERRCVLIFSDALRGIANIRLNGRHILLLDNHIWSVGITEETVQRNVNACKLTPVSVHQQLGQSPDCSSNIDLSQTGYSIVILLLLINRRHQLHEIWPANLWYKTTLISEYDTTAQLHTLIGYSWTDECRWSESTNASVNYRYWTEHRVKQYRVIMDSVSVIKLWALMSFLWDRRLFSSFWPDISPLKWAVSPPDSGT